MRESTKVMRFVLAGLAGVAFVAGFLFKDGLVVRKRAPQPGPVLISLDQYTKPIPPESIGYEEVEQINVELRKPAAMAVGPEDRLYVAGDAELQVIQPFSGQPARVALEQPAICLAVAPNGRLYAGSRDQIHMFDLRGNLLHAFARLNPSAHLTSLTATESALYAADAGNRVVYRFSLDGELQQRLGERDVATGRAGFVIPGPFFDLAIGHDGTLWAVNPGLLALENFGADGDLRSSWGTASVDVDGFCGCCNPTHLAILPDGGFVTAEKGIVRVKVHEPTGALRTVVAGPQQFGDDVVIADLAVDGQARVLVLDPAARAVRIFARK